MRKSPGQIRDLANLRYLIELGAVELAVLNATDEQLSRLKELAEEFRTAVELGDPGLRKSRDIAFHSLLLEMTGSPLIAGLQRVLADFFSTFPTSPWLRLYGSMAEDDGVDEHFALVAAIRKRNIERARAILRKHISCYLLVSADPPVAPAEAEVSESEVARRPRLARSQRT
jgi:DNA-binding GntR family transcriptional regulator